jgi:small conductance mechanosensitive channel
MRFNFVLRLLLVLTTIALCGLASFAWAQNDLDTNQPIAEVVQVNSVVDDADIVDRLDKILAATGWFSEITVRADAGVVFINGSADNAGHREWAEQLAEKTEGVVAVVNRIEVASGSAWDFSPAWDQFYEIGNAAIRHSPMLLMSLVLLIATLVLAKYAARGSRALLEPRVSSKLLRDVVSRAMAIPVFLLGLYFVLSVSGLTGLAVTVIGSTGLMGLVLGFAFRDIVENFLASVLISMNRPFATGDHIEVSGHSGFVQSVNTRSTLLMTLEGNHVQIPNATIYKSTIINFTANPKARFDFLIGIGYEDSITYAQKIALGVLQEHSAVIDDPEPMILVEQLGASTVNIRVYFWVDIKKFSALKVRSAVIRQIKVAFEEVGISMPDEAREVVFPKGVPVQMLSDAQATSLKASEAEQITDLANNADAAESTEGDFASETVEIQKQARESRTPEGGENLLES